MEEVTKENKGQTSVQQQKHQLQGFTVCLHECTTCWDKSSRQCSSVCRQTETAVANKHVNTKATGYPDSGKTADTKVEQRSNYKSATIKFTGSHLINAIECKVWYLKPGTIETLPIIKSVFCSLQYDTAAVWMYNKWEYGTTSVHDRLGHDKVCCSVKWRH